MKAVNNKLMEELKNNVETIEKMQIQNSDLNKKLGECTLATRQSAEEIENLTEGLAKITNFVFSLPVVKSNPEEHSLVESTIRAISQIYAQSSNKTVLVDLENHFDDFRPHSKIGKFVDKAKKK